jgi:phytoene dehydrogenase-like protein
MKTQKGGKAIVIGAGVAGLASAIRLVAEGYQVQIFEKNDFCGGKLSEINLGEFRFDAGPSLFTMPHLVEELYWISGKKSTDFRYHKLDEVCRYFFPDGTRFHMPANEEDRIQVLSNTLGEDPEMLRKYLETSRFRYETIGRLFVERCLRKASTFFNPLAAALDFSQRPFPGEQATGTVPRPPPCCHSEIAPPSRPTPCPHSHAHTTPPHSATRFSTRAPDSASTAGRTT